MQLVTGVTEALQLAPQVTDVHVQAAIMLGMTAVQDMLVKEGLGQGLAFRGEEGFQQAVFGRRQAGEPLAKADIADIGRELQRGPRQRFGAAARRAPPRSRAIRRRMASMRTRSSARLKGFGR
ncbi:hypothetical protein BANRA_05496 [Pseudomonas aeruginosa]|nr:hypothetical protein BANRA_05496 [Pseudomonas aeruginosa]